MAQRTLSFRVRAEGALGERSRRLEGPSRLGGALPVLDLPPRTGDDLRRRVPAAPGARADADRRRAARGALLAPLVRAEAPGVDGRPRPGGRSRGGGRRATSLAE